MAGAVQLFAVLAAVLGLAAHAGLVTISNTQLRNDTLGRVVNAHDGCLVRLPVTQNSSASLFYQYGTVYESCRQNGPVCDGVCGYLGNVFAVYSSPDLQSWTLENDNVLPALSRDNAHISYWEANVGYNALTQQYVMVYWSGHYGFVNNSIAVATASSPTGPFVPLPPINVAGAAVISDTVALFVDDDGTAYVRYNTISLPRQHIIEKLNPSWTASTGQFSVIFSKPDFPWYDGGGTFKRNGKYYTMLSFDCCFCQWGSDAIVFVADSPLGPWLPQSPASADKPVVPAAPFALAQLPPTCNMSGAWSGVIPPAPIEPAALQLAQAAGSLTVSVTGAVTTTAVLHPDNSSLVFPDFPGYGTLVGVVGAYNDSSTDPCSVIMWVNYTHPGAYWCKEPVCHPILLPPANWTNEVNLCADGSMPPADVPDMHMNPCSQFDVGGTNFTVPAQQFSVSVLTNASGAGEPIYLFNGEHFRSSADGLKSHDLQAWIPLAFDAAGRLLPMEWLPSFEVWLD